MEPLLTTLLVVGLLLLAALVAGGYGIAHAVGRRRQDEQGALQLLQSQIQNVALQTDQHIDQLRVSLQQINSQMTQSLEATRDSVSTRLDGAARVIQDVSKQLGQLDESSKRILEVGKDMASLQETLRAPKLRGALSELFLDELLAQILPAGHYRMQHAFQGGEVVDCVIQLQAGLVPVDAKFPLENFKRIVASADDEEKKQARKTFIRDVKIHIDAIASKYIRTDEGTFDFALMYIPAENVYYEIIIKDEETGGETTLFSYALARRVIPVSPNSFYAYLQTILLGLRGLRVEESAREILNNLSRLRKEFNKFTEAFRLVGQHLDNSAKKFAEAEKRLTGVEAKMEQMDSAIEGRADPEGRALPGAGT
jgi:DNA recombination protein RmuC